MNLRNCSRCGKMFNYIGGPAICDQCKKDIEEDFQRVKQYIQDNPRATLRQIADDNKVSSKMIQQWIREERLMFSEHSPIQLQCENCGESILTGRFCAKCKASMANTLSNSFAKPKTGMQEHVKKDDRAGMRFLDT